MKITKFGHCAMLVEEKGVRFLTDPGSYSTGQNEVRNVQAVLITHEHSDHLHTESLKAVLTHNPGVKVFTHKGVGKILDREGIVYEIFEDGSSMFIQDVSLFGFGEKHAEIYPSVEPADNTGFFIGEKFFYPGDAFTDPGKNIDVLALPVAGPWLKLSDSIDYALRLKPRMCFPVHDGMLQHLGSTHKLPEQVLVSHNIPFIVLEIGREYTF